MWFSSSRAWGTFLLLLPFGAVALPLTGSEGSLDLKPSPVEKRADCATIDQFTVESFAAAATIVPTSNTCLFYTRRTNGETTPLSPIAECYAQANGLTTIWDLWPNSGDNNYYDFDAGDDSWLRCIVSDPTQRDTYVTNMCTAYAQACSGHVLVMTDDPNNLPTDGYWNTAEFPAIQAMGGGIEDVTAIDVNGENPVVIWTYEETTKRSEGLEDMLFGNVAKRQDSCDWVDPEPDGEDWLG